MPQVIVHVNDRPYSMVCGEGEEEHLTELVSLIETEVAKLKRTFGQVGDSRLLLMAGLVVADKLSESLRRVEDLQGEVEALKEARDAAVERVRGLEHEMVERVSGAAERVEQLTSELAEAAK